VARGRTAPLITAIADAVPLLAAIILAIATR